MREAIFDTPFGKWRLASSPPPPDLAPWICELWETRGVVGYGYEKLLPQGTAELMINLGPPQSVLNGPKADAPATFRDGWLAGIRDTPLLAAPAHGNDSFETHFVGARLKPEGVAGLLGIAAGETARCVFEAEDLIGVSLRHFRERMAESTDASARLALMCELLRGLRSRRAIPVSRLSLWAIRQTRVSRGDLRIDSLCREAGISNRHLITHYRRAVGLAPKAYARLTRFRAVMARLEDPRDAWADIAADQGYFDQSHLVRDFRQFAGEAPGSFLENRSPDGESVNYAERPPRT